MHASRAAADFQRPRAKKPPRARMKRRLL